MITLRFSLRKGMWVIARGRTWWANHLSPSEVPPTKPSGYSYSKHELSHLSTKQVAGQGVHPPQVSQLHQKNPQPEKAWGFIQSPQAQRSGPTQYQARAYSPSSSRSRDSLHPCRRGAPKATPAQTLTPHTCLEGSAPDLEEEDTN